MKANVYELVTERMTKLMESGQIPWVKPWSGGTGLGHSKNLITGKNYRGINAFLTMGFDTPYFCTFKQAESIGATVKRGEKAVPIVFWSQIGDKDEDGEVWSSTYGYMDKPHFFVKYYSAFNASQLDGLSDKLKAIVYPETKPEPINEIVAHELAEELITKTGAKLVSENQARSFYSPAMDYINLPNRNSFVATAEYYSTAFHEVGHWTGHASRLNRFVEGTYFGNNEYSQEELTAELSAAFICSHLSISTESSERNSAAYLQGWLKKLRNDPKMFVNAAQRAQKASDYIRGES